MLELPVGRDRLLRIDLRHLPPARHREEHVPLELDRVHSLNGIRLAVRRGVRVEDAREVRCRLRRAHDGQSEPSQVGEERQCRRNLRYAPVLFGAVLAEDVDHVLRLHQLEVEVETRRPAGMVLQHLVRLRVAKGIERDAVN